MSSTRDTDNPFAPPKAATLEAPPAEGDYVPDGRKVESGRGLAWFTEAWELFRRSPGIWVVNFIVFMLIMIVFAIIPLGSLVTSLCYPVVAAGLMLGCRELEEGGPLTVGHLFAGFRRNAGSLLLVGVLYLVGAMVIGFVIGVSMAIMIPALMGAGAAPPDDPAGMMRMLPVVVLAVLVGMALMLPLIMALWFAPAIVVFHDVQPMAAMASSFKGCLKNIVPFLVYGVVGLLLGILALIPLGLGMLVMGPIIWITMYTGYRDIFVDR